MNLYVLTEAMADDWPECKKPQVYTDRDLAVKEWRDRVLELASYPNMEAKVEVLDGTHESVRDFLEGKTEDLEWIVNSDYGQLDVMVTVTLHVVQVPNLTHVINPK